MSTWAGYTIYVLAENQDNTLKRPVLVPEDFGIVRTKVPYADLEHIQYTGRGNRRFTLRCENYSDADFAAILATAGDGVARTLTDPFGDGIDYTDMLLMEVKDVWRVTFAQEVHFTLSFEKAPGA